MRRNRRTFQLKCYAFLEEIIMKVDLGNFVSVEEREQLIEKLLIAKDSIVVVDARNLKHSAGNKEFNQLLLSVKYFAERLRRYGRKTPIIELVLPEDPFALDLHRIDELRRVSGVEIKLL
jgi:hypothetical protein